MEDRPLNIPELFSPAGLPIRAVFTLARCIQRCLAEPTSVVSEDSDSFLWVLDVRVIVSTSMFSKAVDEDEQCFGLIGLVGPSVELGSSGAGEPVLFERSGGHDGGGSELRVRSGR